jgi:hypothetical protein
MRPLLASLLVFSVVIHPVIPARACCPAPPSGRAVVNADQTVIIIWDGASKTQHFIRRASFKAEADDFGFIVPTPSQPELSESGDAAFPVLAAITAPEVKTMPRPSGGGCGCSESMKSSTAGSLRVTVLDEKDVAGFRATVLEAGSATDLVAWLKTNGYAYSPQIATWAEPYIAQKWKFTALKVVKPAPSTGPATQPATVKQEVAASSLRLSFKTDRPLFPYREPDPTDAARSLGAHQRVLRIYFLSDARYHGELTKESPWTGQVAWAGAVSAEDRQRLLEQLNVPATSTSKAWWLTEFEDRWPYRAAPADVYFSRAADQSPVQRPPIIQYTRSETWKLAEVAPYVLIIGAVGLLPIVRRRVSRG